MKSSPICAKQQRQLMTDTATPTASAHRSHIPQLIGVLRHRDVMSPASPINSTTNTAAVFIHRGA